MIKWWGGGGGRDRIVVKRPHCKHEDVGSNPAATRNKNRTMEGTLHRRCDVKAELDL